MALREPEQICDWINHRCPEMERLKLFLTLGTSVTSGETEARNLPKAPSLH